MNDNKADSTQRILERYSELPTIRALVQLIPLGFGGFIDTMLMGRIQEIREYRTREFFDELAAGNSELTEEVIQSEDFIHCFLITAKAALNTRRREKIRLFAKFLRATAKESTPRNTDDFEDLLSVLDDLSYTEWLALVSLSQFSTEPRVLGENDLQWSRRFWGDFISDLSTRLNIPGEEACSFMNRISRTGLYDQIVGVYWDYEGGVGMVTPKFFRLQKLLEQHNSDGA